MENVDKIKRGEPVRNPDKIVKVTDGAKSYPSPCAREVSTAKRAG